MCINAEYDANGKIAKNLIVPISDDYYSVNWYSRSTPYMIRNMFGQSAVEAFNQDPTTKEVPSKPRDYTKERAICNVQYISSQGSERQVGMADAKFRVSILPKPAIHTPSGSDPLWRFIKLTFDHQGKYNGKGKYSVDNPSTISVSEKGVVGNAPLNNLHECYGGLTVYEFNYDMLMSMRLFDPKVIIAKVLGMTLGVEFQINYQHRDETDRIKEIIKEIVNSVDSEVEDCFFNFDNSKYERLLREAEQRKYNGHQFGSESHAIGSLDDVYSLFDEYDKEPTADGKSRILSRAINKASVAITDGLPIEDKVSIQYDFIENLIENLVYTIVQIVLSPKVMLLIEMNRQLMDGPIEKLTAEDVLRALGSVITAIIKEVRDLILQEILNFIIRKLEPIIEIIEDLIIQEALGDYKRILQEMMRIVSIYGWVSLVSAIFGGGSDEQTRLDKVDYADIDTTVETERRCT